VSDTVTALLVSPVVGFVCAGALLLLFKALIKNPDLYKSPKGEETPPLWIRSLLVLTCTGVSFAHGSNDGQKGMGLIMLILIGIIPVSYALDMNASPDAVAALVQNAHQASVAATHLPGAARATSMTDVQAQAALSDLLRSGAPDENTAPALARLTGAIDQQVTGVKSLSDIPADARRAVRSNMYLVGSSLAKLLKGDYVKDETDRASLGALRLSTSNLRTRGRSRTGCDGHHRGGRRIRPAGQHHARAVFRNCRDHVRQPVRPAKGHHPQHSAGLDPDTAGVRVPWRHAVCSWPVRGAAAVFLRVVPLRPARLRWPVTWCMWCGKAQKLLPAHEIRALAPKSEAEPTSASWAIQLL
jgi:hypothetical protein